MLLKRLLLQNFRNYKSFDLKPDAELTFIVGLNTSGKSNLIESISYLSSGKSFRAENDEQVIKLGENLTRVKGSVRKNDNDIKLEVTLADGSIAEKTKMVKKYQVNDIPKRRVDFSGILTSLLFEPSDLDLVSGPPGLRREFLDEVLEQTDRDYRYDLLTYTKAIRQRNALLQRTRETGVRVDRQFNYWDEIVIDSGSKITGKRKEFIDYFNNAKKDLFLLHAIYDPSIISKDRLEKYKVAESAAGVTLVGPHRDEMLLTMKRDGEEGLSLKAFGSRGQQRLGVLQLKLIQLEYMRERLMEPPLLLLDDIFSELDEEHINHLLNVIGKQQTIITTTHKEFIPSVLLKKYKLIQLS